MEETKCTAQSNDDVTEEKRHYAEIVHAIGYYRTFATSRLTRAYSSIASLPNIDRRLLNQTQQEEKWRLWTQCIEQNTIFFDAVLDDALFADQFFSTEVPERSRASNHQMEKVCGTLRQVVREWSLEGREEREAAFGPLLASLEHLPLGARVLVPGAGLGRLVFEVCARGYACQGNEWSFFMLLTGHLLLNKSEQVGQWCIHPWLHQDVNVRSVADLFLPVKVPDVLPSSLPPGSDFSFTAGGFVEVYGSTEEVGQWDAVLTCFFMDTAANILEYVRTIHRILRLGGIWANLGPLLYHYSDQPHHQSLELSCEELIGAIQVVGFDILEQRSVANTYTRNPRAMMHTHFDSLFFRARKR